MGRVELIDRVRRLPPAAIDVVVVAAVAVPTAMDAWWNEEGTRQADGWTYLFAAASVVVLLVRRRWPVAVTIASGLALSGLYVLGHHGELLNLPVMVGLYTVAVQGGRRRTVLTGIVASSWSGVLAFTSDHPLGARGGSPVLEMLWPLVPLALGEAVRARRELLALAEVEREREAAHRVEQERARIARELHDVVAHTLAAVNVQMAAAVAAFDTDPDVARTALHQARASSKAALGELRASVAVVRDPSDLAPAPRLDDLDVLAAVARSAGIEVSLHDDRDRERVTAPVELAAYRIVQGALTNVVRHSGATRVAVSVRVTDGCLVVEVVDDGRGVSPPPGSAGFGLIGMAERAHSVGGRVEHGPGATGGFRVTAVLPIGGGGG